MSRPQCPSMCHRFTREIATTESSARDSNETIRQTCASKIGKRGSVRVENEDPGERCETVVKGMTSVEKDSRGHGELVERG